VQILRHIAALRNAVAAIRAAGQTIALVPTMGALHRGHIALIDQARWEADQVIASIFVNPKQFGPGEDLARYPRQEAEDAALLEAAGTALLWMPGVDEMYAAGFATNVAVSGLGAGLCGAARPGHFDGVATVVAKLFNQVRPDVAIFGEKDWQQLAVIRRMATDLDMNIRIIGAATVRDEDGLALSSRNAYLCAQDRVKALALPATLRATARAIEAGDDVETALALATSSILAGGFQSVDYVALVDAASLKPLKTLTNEARILAAARIGSTRLIDNFAVSPKK
jgi:pantoate--beta-alanine ligase